MKKQKLGGGDVRSLCRLCVCVTEACAGCVCVYTYVYDRQKLVQAVCVYAYMYDRSLYRPCVCVHLHV